jgi:MATE family multidrug resistance protein
MTRGLLLSMFGAMVTFFITYLFLYPAMGNHALWLAFILYLIMRGILQTLIFIRHRWE